ncbi:hypothetical protein [Heyndrickxia camelliae]|uniref:Uncharacterized protein n=1 Tax=Heyndrickxia camelliae TaxID=1707093 RepID=A0A2N3LP05_9BACI|nr:hypothetical protein [Heyndrickxia camelliae]PKR86346.1 hypothetical protein CWO92_04400 [Heyndrickxia camelliae]
MKDENGIYKFDTKKAKELGLSKKEIKESDNLFTNVLSQKDIRDLVGDKTGIEPYGKGSIAAKALVKVLKNTLKKSLVLLIKG